MSRGRGKERERGMVGNDLRIGVEARSGEGHGYEGRVWGGEERKLKKTKKWRYFCTTK